MRKSKNNTLNMTTGNPLKLIIKFAIPMLVGNIFQQLYNLADSIIVGRIIGKDALAAVGATGSVTFLFFALCNGIGNGGGIVTSQFFGQGDDKSVKKCITNTGFIMLIVPIIIGGLGLLLSHPLLVLLKTPEDIMADSLIYLRIMCVGTIFVSLYNFISSILRALGDSRTPLYFLIFSCILNVGLDFFFILVLNTGVWGAAIATVIAQLLSGGLCILHSFRHNPYFKLAKEDFEYDKNIVYKTIRLGVPLSLQFSMISISCMALQAVINSFGPVAVAASTAISRIEQVIHQPYQTVGATLSTYTGQNYGARELERVKIGHRLGLIIVAVFSVLMLPIMQFFGSNIVAIFVDDADVIAMGGRAIQISSLFYIFLGVIYSIRGVLGGLGDAFFSLLNGIVEVIGRFTVPFILTAIPAIGLWGIWWSVGIVWFMAGFTAWLRYRSYGLKLLKE
ncbi:putative efflux protein, MATE family [Lachnospiraceae bacterium YSD2013]|nr:putative efflux protein, MATE family [Lachnospiraceae bacterium YSD2013]